MNLEEMELDELKEVAKSLNITIGNIGKAKLIEKITEAQKVNTIISEDDDLKSDNVETVPETKPEKTNTLSNIISAIDDLEESDDYIEEKFEELPMDVQIPVRSITFGTLVYQSTSNNATYLWNEIGQTQTMSIQAITEMNNYNPDFLRKPLVVLLDERAIKQFRLTTVYENVAKVNDLKGLFKTDINNIAATIDKALSVNMRDILISKVRTMYKKNILTDINIIRLLERKLQFDFSDER